MSVDVAENGRKVKAVLSRSIALEMKELRMEM